MGAGSRSRQTRLQMFILDTTRLVPGDIVLTTGDAAVSKAIRKATASAFSHAMLYVADHSYIHSDGEGVHSGNTQRLLFSEASHAMVLRLALPGPSAMARACVYARTQVGKQYSVPEATRSTLRRKNQRQDASNRQFCSRLVAQAYAYAGVALVPNPDYCYPGDLSASALLVSVGGALRPALPSEITFARTESPLDRQIQMTNFILTEVRKLTGADIQTFEQLVPYLITNRQHDHAVCAIVDASGYWEFWRTDIERNPWRYDGQRFMMRAASRNGGTAEAEQEIQAAREQLKRFVFMREQFMQVWRHAPLSYFSAELRLYKTLVEVTRQRIAAAEQVLSAGLGKDAR